MPLYSIALLLKQKNNEWKKKKKNLESKVLKHRKKILKIHSFQNFNYIEITSNIKTRKEERSVQDEEMKVGGGGEIRKKKKRKEKLERKK